LLRHLHVHKKNPRRKNLHSFSHSLVKNDPTPITHSIMAANLLILHCLTGLLFPPNAPSFSRPLPPPQKKKIKLNYNYTTKRHSFWNALKISTISQRIWTRLRIKSFSVVPRQCSSTGTREEVQNHDQPIPRKRRKWKRQCINKKTERRRMVSTSRQSPR